MCLLYSVVEALCGAHLLVIYSHQRRKPLDRGRVTPQLVCGDPLRRNARVTEQYLEEPLGSARITLLLNENIQRGAVLVDRTGPADDLPLRVGQAGRVLLAL